MKIKETTYSACGECGTRKRLTDDAYGCDVCKKPISYEITGKHHQHLRATVFNEGKESRDLEFCSWACCLRGLKKVKSDYFVSLPYLLYDEKQKGIRAKDFFDAVRAFK